MFCKKCGSKLEEGNLFCGKCGMKQSAIDSSDMHTAPLVANEAVASKTENESQSTPSQENIITNVFDHGIGFLGTVAKGIVLLWLCGIPVLESVKMFFLGLLPLGVSGYIVKTIQGDIYEDIKGEYNIARKDDITEVEEPKGLSTLVGLFIKEELDELTLRMKKIPLYSILKFLFSLYVGYYLIRIFISAFALVHNGYNADWLSISLPLSFVCVVSFFVANIATKGIGIGADNECDRKRIVDIAVLLCLAIYIAIYS